MESKEQSEDKRLGDESAYISGEEVPTPPGIVTNQSGFFVTVPERHETLKRLREKRLRIIGSGADTPNYLRDDEAYSDATSRSSLQDRAFPYRIPSSYFDEHPHRVAKMEPVQNNRWNRNKNHPTR